MLPGVAANPEVFYRHGVEPGKLPSLSSYLERLPRGLDSYPDVVVKASVYRDSLASLSLDDCLGVLPDELRELVTHPLPVTAWVPEVRSLSILIAVRDRHFPQTEAGVDAYEEWVFERNYRLLRRPLYRALFMLLSPERLISGVERRWSAFRRGTSLRVVERSEGRADLAITHPENLFDHTVRRGMCGAFRAASVAAGARDVTAEVVDVAERETRVRVCWR